MSFTYDQGKVGQPESLPVTRSKKYLLLIPIILPMLVTGCANQQKTASPAAVNQGAVELPDEGDPWEGFNRKMFAFNDLVDRKLVRPAAKGYRKVVPTGGRRAVGNFFRNLLEPTTIINGLLQGKVDQAVSDLWRFIINSTVGLLGFRDVATHMGLERHDEDFGQTFAVWGLDSGPYLVLPFLGPSTLRDGIGLTPYYFATDPRLFLDSTAGIVALITLDVIDRRAQLLGASRVLQLQLDPYVFSREAFRQRRLDLIYDGDPPLLPIDEELK